MANQKLHIISFDVPYPADYGGVLDIFHKIRHLHRLNIEIHLHCFDYGRGEQLELNKYCNQVNYYPRKKGILPFLSLWPYIIKTRVNEQLNLNLLQDDAPILCEGIHTAAILLDSRFAHRKIAVRPTNIEHHYYQLLAKSEKNWLKKLYLISESLKLKLFDRHHQKASCVYPVSDSDFQYFTKTFPQLNNQKIYPFNALDEVDILLGKGDYALFHGNLSVAENVNIAEFIIRHIASKTYYPLVIAGKNPSAKLIKLANERKVKIMCNLTEVEMINLIKNAHIQLMITFQPTGFKHKFLQSLFIGRHIIANNQMLSGSNLAPLVHLIKTADDLVEKINQLKDIEFTQELIAQRIAGIHEEHQNDYKAKLLISNFLNS